MSDLIEREAVIAAVERVLERWAHTPAFAYWSTDLRNAIRALPASTRDEASDVPAIVEVDDIAAGAMVLKRGFYTMPGDKDIHDTYLRVFKQALEAAGVRIAQRDTEKIVAAAKAMRAVFPDCLCIGDCPCQQAARAFDAAIAEGGKK